MASEQRVAVITGAAGGLGAAFAEQLARDGLAVAVVDIKDTAPTVERVRAAGGTAEGFACDMTDPAAVRALGQAVEARFGRADVLINNAGRYDNCAFADITYEFWRSIMALNLDAMFVASQVFAPMMAARGWGRIINVASNSALLAPPGMAHYVVSKLGAIGLARALSGELGPQGITVNAIAPGPVLTDQLRVAFARDFGGGDGAGLEGFMDTLAQNQSIKRYARPEDVTGLVAFLASDASGMVTGQTLVCDGGWARV